MPSFNLANTKGRDAVIQANSVRRTLRVRWLDPEGRQASNVRLLRSTLANSVDALREEAGGPEGITEMLIRADPEVDLESFGRLLRDTAQVFVDLDQHVVRHVQQVEVLKNPDGSERERRPRRPAQANAATEEPIRLSGRLMKKSEVYTRFVFAAKRQLVHVNGLTYDFLFAIARELEEAQSLMIVGAGPRGVNPIVFTRGGTSYRGFLEGRTQGEQYALILHLSNMELKAPPRSSEGG